MDDDILSKATAVEADVVGLSRSTSWAKMKTQAGVDVFSQPSPHFDGYMYRYTCEIDAPCRVVYEVLKPPRTSAERLAWDKSIAGYERVHTYKENLFIAVIITPTVFTGLISQREFLDLFTFRTIDTDSSQTHWVLATSVKDERRPETRNYVRAFTHPSGYSATAISSDRTKVEFFINIETGGMLPRSLVEMAMPSQQIKYIESLKKEVKRRCK